MSTTPVVDAIGQLHFEGNIIPHTWYAAITFPSGKVDLNAIIMLAEIVYWYRPTIKRDPATGAVLSIDKKFAADKLQRSYASFAKQFGLSKRMCQDAATRLVNAGLITRELRTIDTPRGRFGNVPFFEPVPSAIRAITWPERFADKDCQLGETPSTFQRERVEDTGVEDQRPIDPLTFERESYPVETGEGSRSNVRAIPLKRETYTENTIENTTENSAERERAPRIPARPFTYFKSPHVNRLHINIETGRVDPGCGTTAVEVYYERFDLRVVEERLSDVQEDDLVEECPDLDRLRAVVIAYSRTAFRRGNVQLILDWYSTGIPDHIKTRKTAHATLTGAAHNVSVVSDFMDEYGDIELSSIALDPTYEGDEDAQS